jgi:hypothetical protein
MRFASYLIPALVRTFGAVRWDRVMRADRLAV